MRLIGLAVALTLGVTLAPFGAVGQQTEKTRVGFPIVGPAPTPEELARAVSTSSFWREMKDLGWVYGQSIVAERRYGESIDQLRAAAADLVRLKVDVLFVPSAGLAKLLQLETKTIPIVVAGAGADLVAVGLVANLARPGGNLTVAYPPTTALKVFPARRHAIAVNPPRATLRRPGGGTADLPCDRATTH